MIRKIDNGFELFAQSQLARAAVVYSLLMTGLCVILACIIYQMMPLKEIKPYFFTHYEKGEQIIKIEPLEKTIQGTNKLLATYAARVIKLWHTIDLKNDGLRWEELGFFLSEAALGELKHENDPQKKDSFYSKMREAKLVRYVKIENVSMIDANTFQVDWETYDFDSKLNADRDYFAFDESLPVKQNRQWRTILKFELMPQLVKAHYEHINPIGFVTTEITTTLRHITPTLNTRSDT